jgi:hypothetical protein
MVAWTMGDTPVRTRRHDNGFLIFGACTTG